MINGAHFLLFSRDPAADQDALQKILASRFVPAGEDRLILALPPAEIATHPGTEAFTHYHAGRALQGNILYLTCDDLLSAIETLKADGITCSVIEETEFGLKTTIHLPSGGEIGLYEPTHETAFDREAAPE